MLDPKDENARANFDNGLRVAEWGTPYRVRHTSKPRVDVPAGAPDWWQGDEDASGSFLSAMGVSLE